MTYWWNSTTFQAWKIPFLNPMTFQDMWKPSSLTAIQCGMNDNSGIALTVSDSLGWSFHIVRPNMDPQIYGANILKSKFFYFCTFSASLSFASTLLCNQEDQYHN